MRDYVPINPDDLPDIFDIDLADETYTFRVDYNVVTDYYMLTIIKDGRILLAQEPLLLNQLVGIDIPETDLPEIDLRVMDETGNAKDAGKANFGNDVKLYLDVIDPNGSEDKDPTKQPLGYDPDESTDEATDEEVII